MISGPPGIGKTTAVHLISTLNGYTVLEFNASDTRSKNELKVSFFNYVKKYVYSCVDNYSITRYFKQQSGSKTLILMDEVDGMSSGDRGGLGELSLIIKRASVPIVCICNDRMKVRTLANHCLELRFRRYVF